MQSFAGARDRWEQVIVDDNGGAFDAKFLRDRGVRFATEAPDFVDDIYIGAVIEPIDGVGKVLGSAGPTQYYVGSKRVLTGFMRFDEADVESLMTDGLWTGVILHEMGHVLGIGTMWIQNGVYTAGEDEYVGSMAKNEWANLGCEGKLPVELDGGSGTAGGHWDEECLNQELMTGFVDSDMRLSKITVASLEDMGYGVNYTAADSYDISMLDDCGTYCPDAPTPQAQARPTKKQPLSAEGHAIAVKQAYQELSQARDQDDSETASPETIMILIQETSDGDIYSVNVSYDEALKYMEDSGQV
jgi:hypothetical protein